MEAADVVIMRATTCAASPEPSISHGARWLCCARTSPLAPWASNGVLLLAVFDNATMWMAVFMGLQPAGGGQLRLLRAGSA
jgi:hypothetical protein